MFTPGRSLPLQPTPSDGSTHRGRMLWLEGRFCFTSRQIQIFHGRVCGEVSAAGRRRFPWLDVGGNILKCRIQGLKVERPVPDDLDSAYRVFEESIALAFEEEGISHDAPAEIEYKQQLIRSSVLEDTYDFVFFVAKLGDAVIGTISYGFCGDDIRRCLGEELEDLGELGSIYVLPGFQGRGVASALIAAMLEYLQSRGVRRFYLDCGLKAAQVLAVELFPPEEVRPGLRGIGKTVFSGNAIETFDVEVLGIIPQS